MSRYKHCTYPDCFNCGYADCVAPMNIDQIMKKQVGIKFHTVKCTDCKFRKELQGYLKNDAKRHFCEKAMRILDSRMKLSPQWCPLKTSSLTQEEFDEIMGKKY